jgi:hypothetical protein
LINKHWFKLSAELHYLFAEQCTIIIMEISWYSSIFLNLGVVVLQFV